MGTVPVSGITQFAKERGWHLMIADRLSRLPEGWTGDGALATVRGGPAVLDFVRTLRRRRIPVVDLTFDHPEIRVPRVSGDHAACGRLAAEHFLKRHFRHAVWFSTVWSHSHSLRFEGFRAAWMARASTDLFAVESPVLRQALVWIRDHLAPRLSHGEPLSDLSTCCTF